MLSEGSAELFWRRGEDCTSQSGCEEEEEGADVPLSGEGLQEVFSGCEEEACREASLSARRSGCVEVEEDGGCKEEEGGDSCFEGDSMSGTGEGG